MASQLIMYDTGLRDMLTGAINVSTDAFKVLLVTSAYVMDRGLHTRQSDITGEVVASGYTEGGLPVVLSTALDTGVHTFTLQVGSVVWDPATITARAAIVYKVAGALPSDNQLVCAIVSDTDIVSTNGPWSTMPSYYVIQN